MPLEIGDQVPDLTFVQPDGTSLRLSELATPTVVLIFLRHLA